MPEPNVPTSTPDETQTHRLLTSLTVMNLNLGMWQRELDSDGTRASARTRVLVHRLVQAQRTMIEELRRPRCDE